MPILLLANSLSVSVASWLVSLPRYHVKVLSRVLGDRQTHTHAILDDETPLGGYDGPYGDWDFVPCFGWCLGLTGVFQVWLMLETCETRDELDMGGWRLGRGWWGGVWKGKCEGEVGGGGVLSEL